MTIAYIPALPIFVCCCCNIFALFAKFTSAFTLRVLVYKEQGWILEFGNKHKTYQLYISICTKGPFVPSTKGTLMAVWFKALGYGSQHLSMPRIESHSRHNKVFVNLSVCLPRQKFFPDSPVSSIIPENLLIQDQAPVSQPFLIQEFP